MIPELKPLLQPWQVGPLRLRNRFVRRVTHRDWCVDGAPDHRLREYYRHRAVGGTALVISGACAVDYLSSDSNPAFAQINAGTHDAWRTCVDAVHDAGGRMFFQLWHQGAVGNDGMPGKPGFVALSPSGMTYLGESSGRPASAAELSVVKHAFARDAVRAREIGADGVEVHAGHGSLLGHFLWPETNLRADRYGGTAIADRATFPAEVVQAVREATGPGFAISVRLSQWNEAGYDAEIAAYAEFGRLVSILRSAGADLFHVAAHPRGICSARYGSDVALAGWVKTLTGAPVITVGSLILDLAITHTLIGGQSRRPDTDRKVEDLVGCFQRGDFDLVSIRHSVIGDRDHG
jgi:2,4-dienoyl-CoA reductase-like NADH-dependent reductase (Old Yellow Enzyme family)